MIKAVLIINNHGLPRLQKYFSPLPPSHTPPTLTRHIFNSIASRPDSFCNYLNLHIEDWGDVKLIYRHYATLYFVFAVDSQESDLGILDLIQVFVESLDKCFCNVCELDLIFHSDKVHYVLDEIVSGGMVLETNISMVLESVREQGKLGKSSLRMGEGKQNDVYRR
ncbi:hypothetical protein TrVE_jg6349 [Triparma verrucosa]|uniref:AP complex subunit sigma n=1 Tax=Triparma verrucosa TaxID=1606542 RepID=A0A9W7DQE5_9STRA|nr:hypothetical protein TrVE_jg6349 [Triparma verrucosa]